MSSKFTLISGEANLNKAIASLVTRSNSIRRDLHRVACSVLNHAIEHGDVRPANRLLESLPSMFRANAIRAWLENFGPFTAEKMPGKGTVMAFRKRDDSNLAGAIETPFWEFSPETEYQPLDVTKTLSGLVKRLESDAEKTGRDHSAIVQALKALAAPVPVATKGKARAPMAVVVAAQANGATEAATAH